MCNCGKKRNGYFQTPAEEVIVSHNIVMPLQTIKNLNFEYTGKTGLTVIGSVTRKYYRFNKPGDKLSIDHNDAAAMMAVPVLKRISNL